MSHEADLLFFYIQYAYMICLHTTKGTMQYRHLRIYILRMYIYIHIWIKSTYYKKLEALGHLWIGSFLSCKKGESQLFILFSHVSSLLNHVLLHLLSWFSSHYILLYCHHSQYIPILIFPLYRNDIPISIYNQKYWPF